MTDKFHNLIMGLQDKRRGWRTARYKSLTLLLQGDRVRDASRYGTE